MSILNALRAGIKVANSVTRNGGLQEVVMYERQTGTDGYGPVYAPAVPLHACVDYKTEMARTPGGELIAVRPTLTLLDIPELLAATGGLGIKNNDKITLLNGDTGPTLNLGGYIDSGTHIPVATTMTLG